MPFRLSNIIFQQNGLEPPQDRFTSTCKNDYSFGENLTFHSETPIQIKNAQVMHLDSKRYLPQCSVTAQNFDLKEMDVQRSNCGDLRTKSNFKMDSDTEKFRTPKTTQEHYFRNQGMSNTLSKHMAQPKTDPCNLEEGARPSKSRYGSDYPGRDVIKFPTVKAKARAPVDRIAWDPRVVIRASTQMDHFKGQAADVPKPIPNPDPFTNNGGVAIFAFVHTKKKKKNNNKSRDTSIPQGDRGKVPLSEPNQKLSHRPLLQLSDHKPYNVEEVMQVLGRTNFTQSDGHGRWDSYSTTDGGYFTPKPVQGDVAAFRTVVPNQVSYPHHHPDVPYSADHFSTLNNMQIKAYPGFWRPQPKTTRETCTNSRVSFGEHVGGQYYSTTMASYFTPQPGVPQRPANSLTYRSDIPVHYYDGQTTMPTSNAHFVDYKVPRMKVNPIAVDRLRKSSVHLPTIPRTPTRTEHVTRFNPVNGGGQKSQTFKKENAYRSYVPLGTLPA